MIVNDTENASSWSQEECRRCASCNVICAMAIACSASIGPPLLPAALRHARATGRRAWDASSCCYLPDLLPRSYFQKAGSWAVGISQAQQFGLDGKSLSFRAHMVDWHYDILCDIYIYKICSYTMLYRGSICLKIVQETTQIPARRCWHTTETWDKICLRRGHAWLLGAWQSPVRLAQLGESFDRPGFVSVCSGLLDFLSVLERWGKTRKVWVWSSENIAKIPACFGIPTRFCWILRNWNWSTPWRIALTPSPDGPPVICTSWEMRSSRCGRHRTPDSFCRPRWQNLVILGMTFWGLYQSNMGTWRGKDLPHLTWVIYPSKNGKHGELTHHKWWN